MKPAPMILTLAVTLFALATPLVNAAPPPVGQIRLTPAEIAGLSKSGAGAGSSGVVGIQTTVLFGDPTAPGPYVIALRVPAHTIIAAHTHRDSRTAVVVSGTWWFGYGRATPRPG